MLVVARDMDGAGAGGLNAMFKPNGLARIAAGLGAVLIVTPRYNYRDRYYLAALVNRELNK